MSSGVSAQSTASSKSGLNFEIDNRASEFLHDTINARDLLDSGILCGATEEEILLADEKTNNEQSSTSSTGTRSRSAKNSAAQILANSVEVDMPQVVSGSQPVQKEKKYQCSTCNKKFPDMSSLKRHIPTHKKDQQPFVCGRCQKRFKSEDELTNHMKTHVQEKPYRCSVCSREFSVAQILKRHMLIHSGERAHECEYCGKRFTTKADVTRHVRIHTGEKPHKCPYCESRFVQAGQLKRHLVTHEKYQEQLRDGTLPEKPARKKTKPHKCTLCKAEFFHARQLQSHINFAHDNGGSDGASGSPQISPESRPVVSQNSLHSMEFVSSDPLQADGEWKTYAPDPGTTDAGLTTATFSAEATPTIEWTDAPNPLTPQEMAELKPFIRISGHDDYAPPAGEKANEEENVQQPISASVAPQFVEASQLVQVDQAGVKAGEQVEYIGTTADGKTVIMDFIPTVVGETVPSTAITQPYVTIEAAAYSQDQAAPKVNGDFIQVNQDGTIMSVSPANGYYSANVVKSEVTEEDPGVQPHGDLMELTAVKLGDIQNGVPPEGGLPGNVENHQAGYIPISQSQEKTGFKFEWEMPMDKHSMPEASSCMPIPTGDVNQCMTLPAGDSSGSIYLPVVPAESINKNYVAVTPEEINKQFGSVSIPAPIAEPINYSRNPDDPSAVEAVQAVTEGAQQVTGEAVVVPAQQAGEQVVSVVPPVTQDEQVVSAVPMIVQETAVLPASTAPEQSETTATVSTEEAGEKEDEKPVSMLEELMLVLGDAPQNAEEQGETKPTPTLTATSTPSTTTDAVTTAAEKETSVKVKEELKEEIKTEETTDLVTPKVENPSEYQTIDKNCDIFSGDIPGPEKEIKMETQTIGELKIKIKIESPNKVSINKPKPKSKKKKEQLKESKKNIHQYVCRECGGKCTTLGTLQKHLQKHAEQKLRSRHGIDKSCRIPMCNKGYNKDKCEPLHITIYEEQQKAKAEEKTKRAKSRREDTQVEIEQTPDEEESEEDMDLEKNTLAGDEEFAGAHQCVKCGKSFTNQDILRAHMLLHSGKKPHKCPVCGKKFGTEAYMKGHLLIHTGEAPHKCMYCGKVFSMKGDLNRHVRSHTGEKPHKCEICGKNFTQSGDKKRHMLLQHEGFASKIQFAQHKKKKKTQKQTNNAARGPRRQSRRLSGDHKKSEDQGSESGSSERSPYKCAQCDKSFSHARLLILHMRVHPAKASLMPNKCVDCGETFPSSDDLKNHIMENHEQSLPFKCSVCEKEFSEIDQLEAHRKVHTGEAPYKCGQCNKTFCLVDNLNKHVASHTTEKLYKCKLCDEHFTLRLYLNKHLKSCHTEQKLFMCLACDKQFSEIAALKRHTVTHNYDKTHKCKMCSKAFKSRSGLNFHMLSHKSKHECTVCKKQFSLEIMLKNHMSTHNDSGSSSYSCLEAGCGAVFVTQEQLLRHSQTSHLSSTKLEKTAAVYEDDTEVETEEEMDTASLEVDTASSAPQSFTCAKCNTTFSEFEQLKNHLEKHEEFDSEGSVTEAASEAAHDGKKITNDTTSIPSISTTNEGTSIQVGES